MIYISHSAEDTKRIAAEFARTLKGGELVLLEGTLGAGKTAFAQGVCEALGVQGPVRSPTFAVMHVHETSHAVIQRVVHADFYRFKKPEEALELGLEEWLDEAGTVVLAEWPQLAGPFLPAKRMVRIALEVLDGDERRITIGDVSGV